MCKRQGDRRLGCKGCSNALVWCSHQRDQRAGVVGDTQDDSDGVATPKANAARLAIRTPITTDDDMVYAVMQDLDGGSERERESEQGEGSEAASVRGVPRTATMANPM